MSSNTNTNTTTGDWKNRIPEGNWRTPPQMQSATAWSHQTSMKGTTQTQAKFLPYPQQRKEVWSNKKESSRRNKHMIINTTPQTPIKQEFVYDMGDFPSLNPTQVGIEYTTPNKMSYANIASIPPPPQISRNLNNDFVSINIHEYNNEEEEEEDYYPEYDYDYQTYSIRKKWDDDDDDLESESYN